MVNGPDCLMRLYDAYDRRDVAGVLATLHHDVVWDGEFEGPVRGHDGVSAYLTRLWQSVTTRAEPVAFHEEADGRVRVDVRLTAHDHDGNMLIDKRGRHLFEISGGLVRRFNDAGAA
jgi:ketosteroid isomerase-like protein